MKKYLLTTASIAMVAVSGSAWAASDNDVAMLKQQMQMMQKQMQMMQAKLDAYEKKQAKTDKAVANTAKVVEQKVNQKVAEKLATLKPAAGGGSNVNITMKPTPKISSADGKYTFQPLGRVHLDYTSFDDDKHNHPDNSDWRRARFGFKGTLGEDWAYKYEMDLADQGVAYSEVYLRFSGLDDADITVGHFKPFQGLEQLTSSNYISLIERAAATSIFAPSYTTGVSVQSHGDMWSGHLGVFGMPAGSTSDTDDENVSVAARLTAAPINEEGKVVHLGASGSMRKIRSGNTLTLSTRGETGDGDQLISTGAISNVERADVVGLEAAGVLGGFHAQAEYFMMDVNRDMGSRDADFDGWYAQAGYILTGESRPYKVKSGTFSRIKPNKPFSLKDGGWGAWEVVGRYSNTDLNDTQAAVLGGEMDVATVGINWYLNNHARLMFNYRQANTDANGVVANDDPKSFTVRSQFDF